MNVSEVAGNRSSSRAKRRPSINQPKVRHHPTLGQQDKPKRFFTAVLPFQTPAYNIAVKKLFVWSFILGLAFMILGSSLFANRSSAETGLFLAYPPDHHKTTSNKIFLIGTAPASGQVLVNGQPIQRNVAGHFAPSVPLQLGNNTFSITYNTQSIQRQITRESTQPTLSNSPGFVLDSLEPQVNWVRSPGELLCFSAIASPNAQVSVILANQTLPLSAQTNATALPPNSAVLTQQNQPEPPSSPLTTYADCIIAKVPTDLGAPLYQIRVANQTIEQRAPGTIQILEPTQFETVEVVSESGVARTGPSTDFSRLTPLPKGTRATVSGKDGEWLRLSYGAWIRQSDVKLIPASLPVSAKIRSVTSRQVPGWTELIFPLTMPVPLSVLQGDRTFQLTLHDAIAQTDTIKLSPDPVIERLDWTQTAPTQITYIFHLKAQQQWGYKLRYEGSSLILSLKHPPLVTKQALNGVEILLDPGHGSTNDYGSRGPTGYPEKDVALKVTQLLRSELEKLGATIVMTRTGDDDILPQDRAKQITQTEPAIAISLHYNALPDSGDALKTQGMGAFWYNSQAHSLAVFLHDHIVKTLNRPSYGVFWNNLALTRPTVAPAVLLELGFMINPDEFEWIINPDAQQKLAIALAQGIKDWFWQTRA
jgi:N-acetylmuramoyl-L-alanine amidase